MKTIIAGSRTFNDYNLLKSKLDYYRQNNTITQIVSGGAAGADTLGEKYSDENDIDLVIMRADWDTHGRAAGPIRNRKMAEYAEVLIAVWDGQSRGTKNMIEEMNKLKKPVFIIWTGGPIVAQGVKNEIIS